MSTDQICPACGSIGMSIFYEQKHVPVHSVMLLPTREKALNYPQGDIILGFCQTCGFISNVAFDPTLQEYSAGYEPTQAFSATFNAFHQSLATHLIDRYDLHDKDIIEIGCGHGEFLTMLCELGGNRGIGFDPAYMGERNEQTTSNRVTFINDFYSEKYTDYQSHLVCCKMTLEHIQPVADFMRVIRRSIGDRPDTIVFFQVPNVTRILREIAFWDIYYEHCSYFSMGSLARLFRKCGFDVIDLWQGYDDQYLMIEARPGNGTGTPILEQEDDLEELAQDITYLSENYPHKLAKWRHELQGLRQGAQRAVIWGGGSKGVAFLTKLNIQDEIRYAVDVNPFKHGTYMARTGQTIVSPAFLQEYRPDIVIVMNPIYCNEIQQGLNEMGVTAKLMLV
ncbi:MAG: methyltransferase domain-containing protein [Chloroflexi bacterium]|nr:methyltransferase domain-containing protein [Chloroflexota bacterium]